MDSTNRSKLTGLLSGYCADRLFLKWQNELAECVYRSLRDSYAGKYNEEKMVGELCDSMAKEPYENMHIYSEKIHGSTSRVDFSVRGKKASTELADMVLLSLITNSQELVYAKLAFVQNKKGAKRLKQPTWGIDSDQLFLLHNFPTFKGSTGIFNNEPFKGQEIVFPNTTGSLGNYGLFEPGGEMIVAIASEISAKLKGSTVKYSSLAGDSSKYIARPMSAFPLGVGDAIILSKPGYTSPEHPFLQNVSLSMNAYDFVRNFTLFNIGEPIDTTHPQGSTPKTDGDLFKLLNFFAQRPFLKGKVKITGGPDGPPVIGTDNNINILCVHLELGG